MFFQIHKDNVQLRNRLIRRAKNFSKPYDVILKDGLIARARVKTMSEQSLMKLKKTMIEDFDLDENMLELDVENFYLLSSWQIINKIKTVLIDSMKADIESIEIIHQYPYEGGFVTYLEPLFEKE